MTNYELTESFYFYNRVRRVLPIAPKKTENSIEPTELVFPCDAMNAALFPIVRGLLFSDTIIAQLP